MERLVDLLREKKFEIMDIFRGNISTKGINAYQDKNPYALVRDLSDPLENIFYVMLCEPDKLVYFSVCDLDKIRYNKNGVIQNWRYNDKKPCMVYNTSKSSTSQIHRVVMEPINCTPIHHINKNKLDNRRCNLRYFQYTMITLQSTPDHFRKWYIEFRKIPNLPRYCTYCIEKNINLEYFMISQSHPLLKNITTEITTKKSPLAQKETISLFLQIERALYFLEQVQKSKLEFTIKDLMNILVPF